ncbi:immunoglobulin kappa light chain-like [Pungitius pungitius]|uniref:immunoglobulin kappa light chain-like n=1 Tax=Pungitius pungitius TaxID=134920 RepID=UPI002E13BCD6
MMTSPRFAVYVTCLFLWKMAHATDLKLSSPVHQEREFASVDVGDNITLQCSYGTNLGTRLSWYKQTLGQRPKLVSNFYQFDVNGTFYHEFENNPRFTMHTEKGHNHLTIIDLKMSDTATYYCAHSALYAVTFAEGTVVSVQGSGLTVPALLLQSPSETIQPGGSVTLNCTVQTGTCDGQHSVYWFKDSEESHPALIYTDGGSTDQCERKPNTQTHTCDYNLRMESLNLSHAGTYYCAVVSCGHILFGNRTKLDFEDDLVSPFFFYLLSGSLVFINILVVLLALSVCVMNKTDSCQRTESQARYPASSTANAKGYQNKETLYYSSVDLYIKSRRQTDQTWSECVYYSVRQ